VQPQRAAANELDAGFSRLLEKTLSLYKKAIFYALALRNSRH